MRGRSKVLHSAVRMLLAAMAGSVAGVAAQASTTYRLAELSQLSFAADINNAGQIVGSIASSETNSETGGAFLHAGLYDHGIVKDLGTLLLSAPGSSDAHGINSAGVVVGSSDGAKTTYDPRGHAYDTEGFIYRNGTLQSLGLNQRGVAVNDQGTVAIESGDYSNYDGSDTRTAAILKNGQLIKLPGLGPDGTHTSVKGINNNDEIVGASELSPSGRWHAYLNQGGTSKDLGTLGGENSVAYGVNDLSQVTGSSELGNGSSHAFLYSGGAMKDLGTLGGDFSVGWGINNRGDVVGQGSLASGGYHGFIFENGQLIDLNNVVGNSLPQGWTIDLAWAINDAGVIVGNATSPLGNRPIMLTPVPEAEAGAMALAGLASLAALRRRQRQTAH